MTAAANAIDRLHARNLKKNGSHVSEGLYRIAVPPLVAYYSIDDQTRTVHVDVVRGIV
jgi:hypothetical protein